MGKSVNLQACETDWSEAIAAVASTRDREAFARLFGHFAPRVKSYMLRLSAKDAEAEELAQEVMLLVWRKAELFDATSHGAAAWIFTIARNVRIDAARRAKRGGIKEVEDVEAEFRVDGGALADETLMTSEQQAQLRAALSELPTDQRKVVELSFFEERAHGEISALLGLPLGTVKSRLRLAMERLRKRLGSVA
ncbi:sigma-70 family RNA polymerase sigma factor [Rhizomicrobium palustre]